MITEADFNNSETMMEKNNEAEKTKSANYRVFYILGLIFLPLGILYEIIFFISDLKVFLALGITFIALGISYLAIGLGNKDKWNRR